jgi:hypothetical protein
MHEKKFKIVPSAPELIYSASCLCIKGVGEEETIIVESPVKKETIDGEEGT